MDKGGSVLPLCICAHALACVAFCLSPDLGACRPLQIPDIGELCNKLASGVSAGHVTIAKRFCFSISTASWYQHET